MASPKPLKRSFNKSVKMDFDFTEFEANAKSLITDIQAETKPLLSTLASDFVSAAARHTPPSIGKSSIEKRYWTRPILSLGKLIRNQYPEHKAVKEDYEQFRKGMKYKVLYTKAGIKKGTAFAYTKTQAQAKQSAKIETRGLSRVMWGKSLSDIGAKVPNSLLRILSKSTKLSSLSLNEVKHVHDNNEDGVEITNNVTQIERYAKPAEIAGYRKVSNTLMREMKNIANKNRQL